VPERLTDVAEILRVGLTECPDAYLTPIPSEAAA
jgi:hypothetical protein